MSRFLHPELPRYDECQGRDLKCPFVAEQCHLTLSLSFTDLPYHSNHICDTNWDIMTMTTRVKCCVSQTLTGPPSFPPSPFSLFSLFSPLCRGPKPAKHISKWQLLRLSSKNPRVVDFPRLMWHLWLRNRVEGEKVGPWRTIVVCLGDGREGVKNQNAEDISSQQIDTAPLIPSFFFLSSWTWCALQMAVLSHWPFLESEQIGGGIRGSHNTQARYTP